MDPRIEQLAEMTVGVIAFSELVALGVYGALAEVGLRVPGDVSVLGFDDITADVAVPPMTAANLRLREAGQQAARLALEMAADPEALRRLAGCEVPIPAQLVARESTGPAAAN